MLRAGKSLTIFFVEENTGPRSPYVYVNLHLNSPSFDTVRCAMRITPGFARPMTIGDLRSALGTVLELEHAPADEIE